MLCQKCSAHNQAKELSLLSHFDDLGVVIWNRKIKGGESPYKPDFLFEHPHVIIIVECDQHQHSEPSYHKVENQEEYRERCLRNDVELVYRRPLVILRFNPDDYSSADEDGYELRNLSPWRSGGVLHDEKSWRRRVAFLRAVIKYFSDPIHPPVRKFVVERLFYDGHDDMDFAYASPYMVDAL